MRNYDNYSQITISVTNFIATLTLNRPEIMNAMDPDMTAEIGRAWVELDQDEDVRAIIVTGAGKKFSAGADYKAIRAGSWSEPFSRDIFGDLLRRVNDQLSIRVPVIAALNGDAVGGGATIALLCDQVVADAGARIGDPHIRAGAVAGDGGSVIWSMLCGPLRAKQYLMTGDLMSAEKAERIGLITEVVPPGMAYARALEIATRFANDLAPLAVRWTKYSVNKLVKQWMVSGLDVSIALECLSFLSNQRKEAIDSFLEKRPPDYHNL